MVTVLHAIDLGTADPFPVVIGGDDAAYAAWIRADTYNTLAAHLAQAHYGQVFPVHVELFQRFVPA